MFEETAPLSSLFFFQISHAAHYLPLEKKTFFSKPYLLPSTCHLSGEEEFAKVFFAWNEEGIYLHLEVEEEVKKTSFPNFRSGDSIELFLDTRDLKSRRGVSPFCHHFVFFAEEVNGYLGQEITRFRSAEGHPLCHPKDLGVLVESKPKYYRMTISIPKFCLHGFDPNGFYLIGFTYRINRAEGSAQNFAASSEEYSLEQHPDLWASLHLKGKK